MQFYENVVNGPMNKRLDFGGDLDHESGYRYGSVSRHWWDVPWRRCAVSQCF